MGGIQVRIGCRPGQKSTVPHALQMPPTIRHYVPASSPAGGRSPGVGGFIGDSQPKRLLPLGGSCRRKATEGAYVWAVYRFGLAAATGQKPTPPPTFLHFTKKFFLQTSTFFACIQEIQHVVLRLHVSPLFGITIPVIPLFCPCLSNVSPLAVFCIPQL